MAHHIDFPDYNVVELIAIADLMLEQQSYRFSEEARETFLEYLELRVGRPRFSHARSVRNAIDRARLRQANRLFAQGGRLTRDELTTILPEDIRKSSVFRDDDQEPTRAAESAG